MTEKIMQKKIAPEKIMSEEITLNEITFVHGGLFTSEGIWIHPNIRIDTTELIVMTKGEAYLEEDGCPYHLLPGSYLFFEPGKLHGGTRQSTEQVSFYWFHFHGKLPDSFAGKTGALPERDRIDLLCRQLLHYANTPACAKAASDYCLRLLLLEVDLQCRQPAGGTIRFSEICEWIRMNGEKPLTSTDVAAQFGYHEDYLARLFRKNLNCTMKQYIIKTRMAYLKTQLLSTDLSLKEIAWKAGFQEYKYFLKFFTIHEGMTPTAFRNLYFNTHENKR